MRLVVGLGNPGRAYQLTRHNIGFLALDQFLETQGKIGVHEIHGGLVASLDQGGDVCWFLKPQLMMNRSGVVVTSFARKHQLAPCDILILHDDADLELGQLRIKKAGGTGGHRGLESIVLEWGQDDFYRLRIGIGRDPTQDLADFVLTRVRQSELLSLAKRASWALGQILTSGPEKASNIVNVWPIVAFPNAS